MNVAPLVALALAAALTAAETPDGLWPPAQAERVEQALDAWFRGDDADRAALRLRACGEALTPAQLAAMPTAAPAGALAVDGVANAWRIAEDDDDPRGDAIVALPARYRREQAWPAVVVLADDAEAATRELAQPMTADGAIVLVARPAADAAATAARALRLASWSARTWRVDCRRIGLLLVGAATGSLAEHVRLGGDVWSAIVARGGRAPKSTDTRIIVAGDGVADTPAAIAAWVASQPPAPWSPRPTLVPRAPRRAPADVLADPLGRLASPAPPGADEDALACWRHALTTLPALQAPFAGDLADAKRAAAERVALAELSRAIRCLNQATPAARERVATLAEEIYAAAAKLHARRFLAPVDGGGQAWVKPYRDAVACIRAALAIDPADGRAPEIARAISGVFPRELLAVQEAR